MKIKEENSKEWQNESQFAIEGFTFEPSYFYTLKAKKTILANPPADSGNVRYQLIEVLKKEKDPYVTKKIIKKHFNLKKIPQTTLLS